MQPYARWFIACLLAWEFGFSFQGLLLAEEPAPAEPTVEEPWLEPILVPFDPELEEQILEVQQALSTLHKQMVRRKEVLKKTTDPATKTTLYQELETLRKEREDLEKLLHDLVEEARLSEKTAIDEALARARWLERQQEYWEKKEEIIRDRQE